MRTPQRLAEVMRSVNPTVYPGAAMAMQRAAEHFDGDAMEICGPCIADLALLAAYHESPHIRDVAAQAALLMQGVTVQ